MSSLQPRTGPESSANEVTLRARSLEEKARVRSRAVHTVAGESGVGNQEGRRGTVFGQIPPAPNPQIEAKTPDEPKAPKSTLIFGTAEANTDANNEPTEEDEGDQLTNLYTGGTMAPGQKSLTDADLAALSGVGLEVVASRSGGGVAISDSEKGEVVDDPVSEKRKTGAFGGAAGSETGGNVVLGDGSTSGEIPRIGGMSGRIHDPRSAMSFAGGIIPKVKSEEPQRAEFHRKSLIKGVLKRLQEIRAWAKANRLKSGLITSIATTAITYPAATGYIYASDALKEGKYEDVMAEREIAQNMFDIRRKLVEAIDNKDQQALINLLDNTNDETFRLRLGNLNKKQFVRLLELLNAEQLDRVMREISKENDEEKLRAVLAHFERENGNFGKLLEKASRQVAPRLLSAAIPEQLQLAIADLEGQELANVIAKSGQQGLAKVMQHTTLPKMAAALPYVDKQDLPYVLNTVDDQSLAEMIDLFNGEQLALFLAVAGKGEKEKVLAQVSDVKLAEAVDHMVNQESDGLAELMKRKDDSGEFTYLKPNQAIGLLEHVADETLAVILPEYYLAHWVIGEVQEDKSDVLMRSISVLSFDAIYEAVLQRWEETHEQFLFEALAQTIYTHDEELFPEYDEDASEEEKKDEAQKAEIKLDINRRIEAQLVSIDNERRKKELSNSYPLDMVKFLAYSAQTPRYQWVVEVEGAESDRFNELMFQIHRWDKLPTAVMTEKGNTLVTQLMLAITGRNAIEREVAMHFGVDKLSTYYLDVENALLKAILKGKDVALPINAVTSYAYFKGTPDQQRNLIRRMKRLGKTFEMPRSAEKKYPLRVQKQKVIRATLKENAKGLEARLGSESATKINE